MISVALDFEAIAWVSAARVRRGIQGTGLRATRRRRSGASSHGLWNARRRRRPSCMLIISRTDFGLVDLD